MNRLREVAGVLIVLWLLVGALVGPIPVGAVYAPEGGDYTIVIHQAFGAPLGGRSVICWQSADSNTFLCADSFGTYPVKPGGTIRIRVTFSTTGFNGKIAPEMGVARLEVQGSRVQIIPLVWGVEIDFPRY